MAFQCKRILVTGAGIGIGRSLARKLIEYEAEVIALSKSDKELGMLKGEFPEITTVTVDICDTEAMTGLVEKHGPYHGLVNNAAMVALQPFLKVTPDCFDMLFNANVKGPIMVSQVVAKTMILKKIKGSIVNVSSQASLIALHDHAVYGGTKGALDIITKVMALELGPCCIRVNCVNPTVVLTDKGKRICLDPKKGAAMLERIPLRRFAEIDEVVNVILFLLSDASSMVNGVILPVDGGASAN